jgi:hypothetical protein
MVGRGFCLRAIESKYRPLTRNMRPRNAFRIAVRVSASPCPSGDAFRSVAGPQADANDSLSNGVS